MERFDLLTWSQCEKFLQIVPTINSKRLFSDVECHTVRIQINLSSFTHSINRLDFKTGKDHQWTFKVFLKKCNSNSSYSSGSCNSSVSFGFGLSLTNFPKYCPVETIGSFEDFSEKNFSLSFHPTEVWGIKQLTAHKQGVFKMELNVLEKLPVKSEEIVLIKGMISEGSDSTDYSELLFKDGDVTLFGPEWEYRCHKEVLVNGSPVFQAMFEHDMLESKTNRIEITDIEAPVIRALLLYMYSHEPVGLHRLTDKLLYAANKYQLEDLKNDCINYMLKNISVDNAAEYLLVSDLCDSSLLRTNVLRFVHMHLNNVTLTSGWKKVELLSKSLSELIKFQGSIK